VSQADGKVPERERFVFFRKDAGKELDPAKALDGHLSYGLIVSPLK
jgi:hypothetical protein